jgi:periodic tryptophan protein 2
MAAPKQTQLSLLCCDQSGDFVMASSRDEYEVFVWSFETGNLLEVLAGHSSVISGISCYESTFASVSLDKTLRVWNILEASCIETVQLLGEGLDVKYRYILESER